MKIAYNPKSGAALQTAPDNNDITFDLAGKTIYARGEEFKGTDTTYDIFRKASESVGGQNGLVPAPDYNSDSKNRFLKEDGTWSDVINASSINSPVYTGNIIGVYFGAVDLNKPLKNYINSVTPSYVLRYTARNYTTPTENIPNNCTDGNILHIQGSNSDTAFQLLAGWKNDALYFRSGNEVDGINNNTGEEASQGLYKNTWHQITFMRDLISSNILLTGYSSTTTDFSNLTTDDTLSSALSKLECKTQFVYDWLMSDADDADEKINKWHEVEHFLEGIEETTLNSILNTKADKATTIQGYGLWEKYTDLNEAPMGAFFCGETSVANSPESGNYISGLTLAKDNNAQFRTQLGFVENRVFTRQENGANNWSQWRELAFLGDVAKKATTLAGYGITDAVTLNTEQTITRVKTFTNGIKTPIIVNQTSDNALFIGATDNYYCDLNTQLSPGYSAIIPRFQKIGSATSTTGDFGSARKGVIRLSGNASESQLLFDHYNATIHYRGSTSNGAFTEWKRLAFKETTLSGYGITDAVPFLNMVNASNLKSIGVGYVNANGANGENGGIISFGSVSYQTQIHSDYSGGNIHWRVNSNGSLTNWKNLLDSNNYSNYAVTLGTEQTITGTKIFTSQLKSNMATGTAPLVVNSTTMVANLNANYLGGLNKNSFQKAVYDYVNVVGTANDTALPTVLAPSIYNGTNSIGGNFKYYDTKFFSTQTKTSNRCQLAYGYDVDSIHFRRYKDGTWYDWKKVVFTEGTDNLKITNSSARTTYVKDSTHSMFFGYSDYSYNRGLYDNSQSNWIMYTDSSNQTFINQWLGNVGIKTGNTTLTAALQVGGSILASGDITAYSDRRLKSNIQTLENRGYIEPVTFEKDGKQCIGFVAQDVEEKYPELVNSEGEYLSLNYQQYTAVLQAQIIELDKRIKELENGFSKQ